jgi:hypothetical protein
MRLRSFDWWGIELEVNAGWPDIACMRFQMAGSGEIREPVFIVDKLPKTAK